MIIQHKPNLILEALAYLGRRASNKTWDQMEQRIQQRKVLPSPALCQALERLKALTHQLDRVATAEEKEIQALFGNLEGFPYNTIGSSSPAFFLLYPLLDRFQGDWEAFSQLVDGLDREEVVWGIASIFEDDLPNQHRMDTQAFTDLVLGLNAPDSTKVALLELSRNHRAVGARALACLRPIVAHLEEHQAQLEELAAREGGERLHTLLAKADPKAAEEIHAHNVKRVIRALEFYRLTGKRISEHNEEQKAKESPYNFAYFVLNDERGRLYERIDARVDQMMEEGLLQEVERLKEEGLRRGMVSMQGLGYKELLSFLDGECSLDEAVRILKRDTRHFAKRQLTWFRRDPRIFWIYLDEEKDFLEILKKSVLTVENSGILCYNKV